MRTALDKVECNLSHWSGTVAQATLQGMPKGVFCFGSGYETKTVGFWWGCCLCILMVFFFETTFAAGILNGGAMPAFNVEGMVSLEQYVEGTREPVARMEGKFLFTYSDSVWEIQISSRKADGVNTRTNAFSMSVLNCKRIPEGIRYYVTYSTNLLVNPVYPAKKETHGVLATAESVPFPPPEYPELLLCWLSLCPDPPLPVIDKTRIRRLLSLAHFTSPENTGTYSREFLGSDQIFLSNLNITNNGVIFYGKNEMLKPEPPFERGFKELAYETVGITNINGISFPVESVLRQYTLINDATNCEAIYPCLVTRLKVERIDIGSVPSIPQPPMLIAEDHRPPNLPSRPALNYMVSNDTWVSVTNDKIAVLASLVRQHGKDAPPPKDPTSRRLIILIIFGISTLALFGWIFLKAKSKHE
jgi:hypothetical protein